MLKKQFMILGKYRMGNLNKEYATETASQIACWHCDKWTAIAQNLANLILK